MAGKKGLFARFIEGPERSETYASSTLPTNRWQLGWDVLKTNFSKMFLLNILLMVFLIPLGFILITNYGLKQMYVDLYPFTQNLGLGYSAYPSIIGLAEQISMSVNIQFFQMMFIAVFIIAVGVSGGAYVMRNFVWAEGVSISSDFLTGVKKNYFIVLFTLILYLVIMMLTRLSVDMSSIIMASSSGNKILLIIAQAVSYLLMAFSTIVCFYMITLGVTYKMKFRVLIRNASILALALLPLNVFFIAFAFVCFAPFLFMNVSIIFSIGLVLVFVIGFTVILLVWTNYSHWVFDKYLNDKIAGAKKNRGIYKPNATEDDGELLVIEKSKLMSRPIKPITDDDIEIYELPTSFSRKDLAKLEETKTAMRIDRDLYTEQVENGTYVDPNSIDSLMSDEVIQDDNNKTNDDK